MRIKLALAGGTGLALTLALGWYQVAACLVAAYAVWMCVRVPLERRDRLRQVDPTWHRGATYDRRGRRTDGTD